MDAFVRSRKTAPVSGTGKGKGEVAQAADADAERRAESPPAPADAKPEAASPPPWLEDDSITADERALRQFDLDKRYGPCIGMTRTERWRRAHELGLDPPPAVLALLQAAAAGEGGGGGGAREACLWEGRV